MQASCRLLISNIARSDAEVMIAESSISCCTCFFALEGILSCLLRLSVAVHAAAPILRLFCHCIDTAQLALNWCPTALPVYVLRTRAMQFACRNP